MGKHSKIDWLTRRLDDGRLVQGHTWNLWRGCTKVSPGCDNCYAETMSKRNPLVLGVWGNDGHRAVAAEDYKRLPYKWNLEAMEMGVKVPVFAFSLADWLEDRPELVPLRETLLTTIAQTPHLDWLLLTKRIEGWQPRMMEVAALDSDSPGAMLARLWLEEWAPKNAWIGVTFENQEQAYLRMPWLAQVPAVRRWLSMEPLLEGVDLSRWVAPFEPYELEGYRCDWGGCNEPAVSIRNDEDGYGWLPVCEKHQLVHWIIAGGESGHGARSMDPAWARGVRDQAVGAHIPFFFKQWGEWLPLVSADEASHHPKAELAEGDNMRWVKVGKNKAGHLLDGREWLEHPTSLT